MKRIAAAAGLLSLTLLTGCGRPPVGDVPGLRQVFGETGMGPGEFSYPRAATLGPDGHLYIVDKAARLQCYTRSGEFLRAWRTPEHTAGKPTGLGAGPDGRIYAADTHYGRVLVFEPDGRLVGSFGRPGRGPGEFLLPTDVAIAPDGTVYVGEYGGNDRISRFTPTWQYEFSFGGADAGDAALQRPQTLRLDVDGTLWVADACNHRICHFSAAGELLASFGRSGTGPGELRFPYGLDLLADGTLVVCEYGNNRVQRFDRTGRSLGTWGSPGRQPGQLAYPWAVIAGPRDVLFVLDSGNNRVQVVDGAASGAWRRP